MNLLGVGESGRALKGAPPADTHRSGNFHFDLFGFGLLALG